MILMGMATPSRQNMEIYWVRWDLPDEEPGSFVEYFDAISRGEYDKNRRPAPLRTLELVFLNKGRKALGWEKRNESTDEDV